MDVDGQPLRVLLVEDNPGDALLLTEALEEAPGGGMAVVHAETVGAAVEALADDGIDCVLSDLGLPDATGADVVTRLIDAAGDRPVLVMSGSEDEATLQRSMDAGARAYVTKSAVPDPAALERLIRDALR